MPAGRPTKYTPAMCETVLAVGKEGGGVAEMADACDVHVDTLYAWDKVHEEFSEAFSRAQVKAEAFHARRIRAGLDKPPAEFQGAPNLKYMAQRFPDRWSEKRQVEHSGGVKVEEVRRTVVDPVGSAGTYLPPSE